MKLQPLFIAHCFIISLFHSPFISSAHAVESGAGDIKVILIEDSFIYMNAGRDRGVQVGDLFTVTRPGQAIVDPETGDTLGHEPVPIAKLRVQYAAPHYSRTYALEVTAHLPVQVRDRISRWEGESIGRVPSPLVVELEQAPAGRATEAGEDQIFKQTKKTGDVVGDLEIDGEVLDYDFGDVDGDGLADLVALEERRVSAYRTAGGTPDPMWSETIKGFQYVSLELYDADGDGQVEIYVSQKLGNTARTDVYAHKGGHVSKLGQIKGVFVRQIGDGFYAQRYGFGKPFAGPVMEIKYDPGANAVSKLRDVKEGPYNVLGMGIGKSRMAFLDFNDRLTITDRDGNPVWRGTQPLGGSTQELPSGNGREKERLKKKIVFGDFDGNGVDDLLVVKNELNPFWGVAGIFGGAKFKNGKFIIYTDRPGGWDVLKETREFEGYVSDYEFTKVGGTEKQLSLCLVSAAGREKFKSRIIVLREL